MNKLISTLLGLTAILCIVFPHTVYSQSKEDATDTTGYTSNKDVVTALLTPRKTLVAIGFPTTAPTYKVVIQQDARIRALTRFLTRYNSSLTPHAEFIVSQADIHNVPWTIVSAIAGTESTFCKHIPRGSYNCWGWNNGKSYFSDLREAITVVSRTLGAKYFAAGLNTPERIAPVYAPPSRRWAYSVRYFTSELERFLSIEQSS